MIPYKWPVATAVPQNFEAQREIAKAFRALAGSDDEALRQRRIEIAFIRNELEIIGEELSKLRRNARALLLSELHKYGYNPNEPRVPAGNPDGGRWTREDWNGSSRESTNGSSPNDVSRPLHIPS